MSGIVLVSLGCFCLGLLLG